jgi:nitrogen fixation NifU-like protein
MEILYKEELLDHYRFPRFKGALSHPNVISAMHNPSCGDQVSFQAILVQDCITQIAFDGVGCIISQATASMMCELIKDKPISFIMALTADDVCSLIGIQLGLNRLKCALLFLHAVQQGLHNYKPVE